MVRRKKDFSTGGIVWDPKKEKLLIIKVENLAHEQVWTFPKGHPEKGESDQEAALREVREETGWDCAVDGPLMDVFYDYTRKGVHYKKTVRWFSMTPTKKVGRFDPNEIMECKWASFSQAQDMTTYESDKKLLAAFHEKKRAANGAK